MLRFVCVWAMTVLAALPGATVVAATALQPPSQTPPGQESCDENPGEGYRQSIAAAVDGDELRITVSDRFGGAVESLTWRGKEFINIYDHGRQISYAWSMDGYGECLNPTEPGSARDFQALTSTSELLSVCKAAEHRLTTTTQPAFWLAPGESGFCEGGATTAVNETLVSDQILQKTMQIGYEGLDNVILFEAEITNPQDHSFMRAEIPTGYLTGEFSALYFFNPQTGELQSPESDPLVAPWSFLRAGSLPPIIATPDGAYAMGAYYGGPGSPVYYGLYRYDSPIPTDVTNKWHIVVEEMPYPAGLYHYRTFAIVGTLEAVQETMQALYALHPTDFSPPMGYVDLAHCDEIAGWAWDPGLPDEAIEVALYELDEGGVERLIDTVVADVFRSDLVTALGDNGRHGFHIATPLALQDGETHTIRVYAVNPDPVLDDAPLIPESHELTCPAAATDIPATDEPPATAEATPRPTEPADAAPAQTALPTPPPARSQPICPLALIIGGLGLVFTHWQTRREMRGHSRCRERSLSTIHMRTSDEVEMS